MTPRVQYVTAADGASIAWARVGTGPVVVELPPLPFRHLQRSWDFPEERHWFERLAEAYTLVQYDPRGMGLSQRDGVDLAPEAQLLDLEAVLAQVGGGPVALLAFLTAGPIAIAYAARHPEQVSHLVLWSTAARIADAWPPQTDALVGLIASDWELFTEAAMRSYRGWSQADDAAHRQAVFLRECVTPDTMRTLMEVGRRVDVTADLPAVRARTLVVHRRQVTWLRLDLARELASRIPGARLALLDGDAIPPFSGDPEQALALIEAFLAEGRDPALPPRPRRSPAEPVGRRTRPELVTIVFTDLEGSTALTERLGDARAREVLRAHERLVRDALRAHDGLEVKAMGDGFMAAFASARRALEFAGAVQAGQEARNATAPDAALRVRVGVNAGEPVAEGDDLFGSAVNLAARIAEHARPGGILVADVVRQLVAGKGFAFADAGETPLRGFDGAVRLHEVRWRP